MDPNGAFPSSERPSLWLTSLLFAQENQLSTTQGFRRFHLVLLSKNWTKGEFLAFLKTNPA
jgi:hypothetical protein